MHFELIWNTSDSHNIPWHTSSCLHTLMISTHCKWGGGDSYAKHDILRRPLLHSRLPTNFLTLPSGCESVRNETFLARCRSTASIDSCKIETVNALTCIWSFSSGPTNWLYMQLLNWLSRLVPEFWRLVGLGLYDTNYRLNILSKKFDINRVCHSILLVLLGYKLI